MTHNQIDYWKMRNEKLNNEQRNAETKRYNLVQEELKKIDQDLQRDLMAINAKYKERELDLSEQELAWKKRFQESQLRLDQSRVEIQKQQNSINAMAIQETKRSNLVQESVAKSKLQLEKELAPYTKSRVWSETSKNNAMTDLTEKQVKTESYKQLNSISQSFHNVISPFINLFGTVLRTVSSPKI